MHRTSGVSGYTGYWWNVWDGLKYELVAEFYSRQAKALQSGLLALLERVDKVKEEHEKLEAENRFLQEYATPNLSVVFGPCHSQYGSSSRYIGSLMATSKITGPGPSGNRNSRSGMGRVK